MKYLFLTSLLLLVLSYPTVAHVGTAVKWTPKIPTERMIPSILWFTASNELSEPDYPTVLKREADALLKEFENVVILMVDKTKDANYRLDIAKNFAKRFNSSATIQVKNSAGTFPLTPLNYFKRLIALPYKQVNIGFEVENSGEFQEVQKYNWKKTYTIKQKIEGERDGVIAYSDYTIRLIDMFFHYTPQTKTWTKDIGDVRVVGVEVTTPKPAKPIKTPAPRDKDLKKKKASN